MVLEVADTGSGITPERLPHVFEPFCNARKHKNECSGPGRSWRARSTVEQK